VDEGRSEDGIAAATVVALLERSAYGALGPPLEACEARQAEDHAELLRLSGEVAELRAASEVCLVLLHDLSRQLETLRQARARRPDVA